MYMKKSEIDHPNTLRLYLCCLQYIINFKKKERKCNAMGKRNDAI